ncbi:MAG TPA: pyridoxamine 5'-phosphate oxidase [Draconibacterium sp.]|nr:pyridoxamine 5'-phosphate oxidase [Draconibacterium sp.]
MKIESIRREYKRAELSEINMGEDPILFFEKWMKEALESTPEDATDVALSTHGTDGFPQSRIVLLKHYNADGFVFFTNYNSQKGRAIEKDPRVGLHFFWPKLERQIRITGFAEKTSTHISDEYFHSRPFESQVAAAVSEQSSEIPDRQFLEEKFEKLKSSLGEKNPDRPDNWGGYLVRPEKIEFWQGRENRLHDRIVFEKNGKSWKIKRLAP